MCLLLVPRLRCCSSSCYCCRDSLGAFDGIWAASLTGVGDVVVCGYCGGGCLNFDAAVGDDRLHRAWGSHRRGRGFGFVPSCCCCYCCPFSLFSFPCRGCMDG